MRSAVGIVGSDGVQAQVGQSGGHGKPFDASLQSSPAQTSSSSHGMPRDWPIARISAPTTTIRNTTIAIVARYHRAVPGRLFLLSVALGACGDNLTVNPPPTDPFALPILVDTNPDPKIVEVNLVASPGTLDYLAGKPADIWGYRDGSVPGSLPSVPGPVLAANQGDQVIVHFRNELPDATTIHWHGIRVPNASDGSDHTQAPVPPGGTFDYTFTVPDAATFWYHPHLHGDVQVEKGLYAPLVVRGRESIPVTAERVFVLDDVKLGDDGNLDSSVDNNDMMFGRQGNTLLVDGKVGPTLAARAGARERWRFVDAANSRFFDVALPGHTFLVIGFDGGLLPAPYETDTLLIAPGERYDVIVELTGEPGDTIAMQTLYYDRARGTLPDDGQHDLMTVELGDPASPLDPLPTTWGTLDPIPVDASTPTQTLVLHEDGDPPDTKYSINGQIYPDVTPIDGTQDAVAIWSVNDDVGMDHPFHLHGMFFQVLDIDGTPPLHAGWKDTVVVPAYKTLRFAVRYGGPGHWMYHCHILEHQEGGMMGVLEVHP
jgi:FtsP/CotA-like multicopper oxidase with cupredoxin domain